MRVFLFAFIAVAPVLAFSGCNPALIRMEAKDCPPVPDCKPCQVPKCDPGKDCSDYKKYIEAQNEIMSWDYTPEAWEK